MDEWRTFLYPLGFLSSLAFGLRFLLQWIQSEQAHKSVVTASFWQISLLGNLLLLVHSFIQVQFHVCLLQGCNAVISWRNLNLIQKSPPYRFNTVIILLSLTSLLITCTFALQAHTFSDPNDWFRIPQAPWQTQSLQSISIFWHILGTLAYLLFSTRFWVQWWIAERTHQSTLPRSFWWLSLLGAIFSILYFQHIGDSVNLIGLLLGIIPYIRNIMLIQKTKTS